MTIVTLTGENLMDSNMNPAAYLNEGCYRPATKPEARSLAGMYPLPENGGRIIVAINHLTANRLFLHNLGGAFYLNATLPVSFWAESFGVRGRQ